MQRSTGIRIPLSEFKTSTESELRISSLNYLKKMTIELDAQELFTEMLSVADALTSMTNLTAVSTLTARRCLKIDKPDEFLGFSINAHPESGNGALVGFVPYGQDGLNGLCIMHHELGDFFSPNRTLLLTLQLTRLQSVSIFRLKQLPD